MQEAALPSAPHHCILSGRDGPLSPWLPICCHGASGSRRDLHAALSSSRAHRGAEVPGGLAVTPNGPHVSLSYLPFSASLWVLGLLLSQPASTVVLILPGRHACPRHLMVGNAQTQLLPAPLGPAPPGRVASSAVAVLRCSLRLPTAVHTLRLPPPPHPACLPPRQL